jgi:predicted TIM-barrel fold metal-dependent hydrolase
VKRVAKRGILRGLDIANSPELKPLWDPYWNPLWEVINDVGLPLHFHTIGGYMPEHIRKIAAIGSDPMRASLPGMPEVELPVARAAAACNITAFQINMAAILTAMIFSGVLERCPRIRLVLGEAGIGWIPYVLWRMDAEWQDQYQDLSIRMRPSDYWRRQCWATYQTDPIGVKLLDELGADRSCGARTSLILTASGRTRRSTSNGSWAACRPPCAARSCAKTRRSCTASRSTSAKLYHEGHESTKAAVIRSNQLP